MITLYIWKKYRFRIGLLDIFVLVKANGTLFQPYFEENGIEMSYKLIGESFSEAK